MFLLTKRGIGVSFGDKKWNWFVIVGHLSGTSQRKVGDVQLKDRLALEHTKMESNFHPQVLTGEAQRWKPLKYAKKKKRRDLSRHCHRLV